MEGSYLGIQILCISLIITYFIFILLFYKITKAFFFKLWIMIDKTSNETQKVVQIICIQELLPKIISAWTRDITTIFRFKSSIL